jgi:asparagine synthase (glutamine-hydrolysing)
LSGFLGTFTRAPSPRLRSIPAPSRIGRYQVLFHGYTGNRDGLCRSLSLTDASAPTDEEIIALCYLRFGENLQTRIFGEFALALFDEERDSLLLTHDALGVQPLFSAATPEGLIFATSLEDILAVTGVNGLDEEYVADFLAGLEVEERTPYRHIRRIRQGHALVVRRGSVREFRHYDPSGVKPLCLTNASEYEERCRALVIEGVSASLPSVGKTWCELSGGLDSSTVVSIAAGALKTPIDTFSIVFSRSQRADESRWIDAVLSAYPLPSHRIDADGVPPFSELPDCFCAEPSGAPIITAYNRARKALLREHAVDVVLTGSCGDAVFAGDSPEPFYIADELFRRPSRAIEELQRWARSGSVQRPLGYWFAAYALRPRLRRLANKSIAAIPPPAQWIRPEYSKQWQLERRGEGRRISGLSIADEYFWQRVLRGALRASRAHPAPHEPCAYRNPLLYLPLVEFMAAVPWREKMQPGEDRPLQRRALRGLLPEPTRLRRGKRGPTQALLAGLGSGDEWAKLLTARSALIERGYVDAALWRKAVNLARAGACESIPGFLQACALEAWFATLDRAPKPQISFENLLAVPATKAR